MLSERCLVAGRSIAAGHWVLAVNTAYLLHLTSQADANVFDIELNWLEH